MEVGIWGHHAVCEFPLINFRMPERIFVKLGIYIMAPEPILMAYFLSPAYQSVCLYVYPPIIARQWLNKNITVAVNTHAKIELLDLSFCILCHIKGKYAILPRTSCFVHGSTFHIPCIVTVYLQVHRTCMITASGVCSWWMPRGEGAHDALPVTKRKLGMHSVYSISWNGWSFGRLCGRHCTRQNCVGNPRAIHYVFWL
jgi:hypothetical protein